MGPLLVLDNHDSFTFNLVQYFRELGQEVVVAENDGISIPELVGMQPSRIVLSPGPGRPEEAGIMPELMAAMAGRTPILGVCLGHQGIARYFGGRITYAPSIMHGKVSQIRHDGSRLFQSVVSPFPATRYHSLVVEEGSLPSDLRVTARSEDGVIMGLEHREWPIFGIQYHPESIMTPSGMQQLRNFCEVGAE
jgi:anthranilate synthase/aminodeoxychorismate synthase-like glutamine amidotransferase